MTTPEAWQLITDALARARCFGMGEGQTVATAINTIDRELAAIPGLKEALIAQAQAGEKVSDDDGSGS